MLTIGQLAHNQSSYEAIADALAQQGYFIGENILLPELCLAIQTDAFNLEITPFGPAGIGRGTEHQQNLLIRRDTVRWISGATATEQQWLSWTEGLRNHLNRSLFMGLQSFESHFASYESGDFYKRHVDSFRGKSNRKLSLTGYFNNDWTTEDGGELLIYARGCTDNSSLEIERVLPKSGTVCLFMSEDFPHEVLATQRHRRSIAGWFRIDKPQ